MALSLPHWKLTFTSLLHGLLLGYSAFYYLTVLNSMEPWVKSFASASLSSHYDIELTDSELNWVWSFISGSYAIGCVFGASTISYPSDKLGRRDMLMLLKNTILMIGALLQGIAKPINCVECLVAGRMLAGVGIMQTLSVHMFMAECSPTEFRGIVSCLPAIGQRLWLMAGALLSLEQCGANEDTWHLALMYPIVPSFLHLLATPFIPRSPKFLYITGHDETHAKNSVLFYHGPGADLIKLEREFKHESAEGENMESATLCQVLGDMHMRWPLVICIVATIMFPLTGIDIAFLYSTGIMRSVGISAQSAPLFTLLLVQLPGTLAALVAIGLIEKVGRRPLLLIGSGMSVFGVFCLSLTTPLNLVNESLGNVFAVLGFALIYIGFSSGISMIGPLIPGEIAPQASRSLSLGIGNVFDWTVVVVIVAVYPSVNDMIGSYAALPIAVAGALCWLFMFCFLPETKGKSVDEVIESWDNPETT